MIEPRLPKELLLVRAKRGFPLAHVKLCFLFVSAKQAFLSLYTQGIASTQVSGYTALTTHGPFHPTQMINLRPVLCLLTFPCSGLIEPITQICLTVQTILLLQLHT